MAKKAKTTAKVKARKTAPKKHRKPFLVQGVGIFSSIPFSGTLIETAFKSGLSTGGATIPIVMVKDELGYDPTNLKNGLGELNGNAAIGLIVAIGGLVTLNQAADLNEGATNYFISIMGGLNGVPGPTSGYFRGGICLQSYNRNRLRIAKVKLKFGITNDMELCLLSNPNSSMVRIEKNGWINNRYVDAAIDPGTANPLAVFRQAFTKVAAITSPKVKAVIVSADPYFFTKGSALVEAANEWIDAASTETRVICYPLKDYSVHNPKKHVLHGPDLKKAYTALGKKANKILTSTSTPNGSIEDADEEIH